MADKRNLVNRAKPKQGQQQKPTSSHLKVPTPRSRPHREQDANVTLLGVSESRSLYSLAWGSKKQNFDSNFATSSMPCRAPAGRRHQNLDSTFAALSMPSRATAKGKNHLDATLAAPSMPSKVTAGNRHNMDFTFAAPTVQKAVTGRTATGSTNTIANKKADLVYNDYLQALMKQEIVNNTIKAHEEKINDQILIETERLNSLRITLEDINDEIHNLKEQENMVQLLHFLKPKVRQVEDLLEKYGAENIAIKLQYILNKQLDLVTIKNIKMLESQEEFDKLMEVLEELKTLLEKISIESSCLEEIDDVAKDIRHFKQLNGEIMETIYNINGESKAASRQLIRKLSDLFAHRNGY